MRLKIYINRDKNEFLFKKNMIKDLVIT